MFSQYSDLGFTINDMQQRFTKNRNDNTIFVTERCNNKCIMCCQPPSKEDDGMRLFERNVKLIETADPETDYICITGGEPTLYPTLLFKFIDKIKETLPHAVIHLLSNGRAFSDMKFLYEFHKHAKDTNMVIGIPIHSDNYLDHNMIAGASGAFLQTIKGLHNLGILGYEIELRIILMQANISRLYNIAEYITFNLPFVSQVSLMGLEITGYAHSNFSKPYLNPKSISTILSKTVQLLDTTHNNPRIFNIPLCLLNISLWKYATRSISDWKVYYSPKCDICIKKSECCGLFSTSSVGYMDIVSPFN